MDTCEIDMDEMRVQNIKKLLYQDYFVGWVNLEDFENLDLCVVDNMT